VTQHEVARRAVKLLTALDELFLGLAVTNEEFNADRAAALAKIRTLEAAQVRFSYIYMELNRKRFDLERIIKEG
jgi:hypothetical protein